VTKSAVMGVASLDTTVVQGELAWPLWAMAGPFFAGLIILFGLLYAEQFRREKLPSHSRRSRSSDSSVLLAYCTVLWGMHSLCLLM
jgi:hypothetical protein